MSRALPAIASVNYAPIAVNECGKKLSTNLAESINLNTSITSTQSIGKRRPIKHVNTQIIVANYATQKMSSYRFIIGRMTDWGTNCPVT